jgi:hypothetical protein
MEEEITLESLETTFYTQKQIQNENVKYGLARCSNESKEKSIAKLRAHLLTEKSRHVKIQIDGDMPLEFTYPPGKSKQELVYVLYQFFNQ